MIALGATLPTNMRGLEERPQRKRPAREGIDLELTRDK
jgi:hypothetical protein